jgi:hypothetical protein
MGGMPAPLSTGSPQLAYVCMHPCHRLPVHMWSMQPWQAAAAAINKGKK